MTSFVNRGYVGDVIAVRNGSSDGADTSDVVELGWDGNKYVYLPGVAGNYLSVPDEAALDITGDIDIRVKVALDDWTPAATMRLVNKRLNTSDVSYALSVNSSSGLLSLSWSTDGTIVAFENSTLAPAAVDGEDLWVRATLDIDNGASAYEVKFYTSTDGATWSQLGATLTGGSTTSIYAGTQPLLIGMMGTANYPLAAKVHRAQILNGIDGTPVLDVDCSQITSGSATTFAALTGQTVTINRSTSGSKSAAVTSPVWLAAEGDFVSAGHSDTGELLTFGPGESFSTVFAHRQFGNHINFRGLYATAGQQTWTRLSAETVYDIDKLVISGFSIPNPYAQVTVHIHIFDRVNNVGYWWVNGVLEATNLSVNAIDTAGSVWYVSSRNGGGSGVSDEILGFSIFSRVLSSDEVAVLTSYYQGLD